MNIDQRVNSVLEDFGLVELRPWQREVVDSIMNNQDTLVVMPTGSGKSAAFQLPARIQRPGLTVVASPLIALMRDQTTKARGVRAVEINSSQSKQEEESAKTAVLSGDADILYISPEKLSSRSLPDLIGRRKVRSLIVDEAHCISVWGHDFRPSYRLLPRAREIMENPTLAMFTATAPPHVRDDIVKSMGLKDYRLIQGEPLRDNISFRVCNVSDTTRDIMLLTTLKRKLREEGSVVIYTSTIKEVEDLYERLSKKFKTAIYHGQMDAHSRKHSQESFMSGDTRLMICTSAFGMGIDKPDIYTIIHLSPPGSLEQYVQESGRAGRDGNQSEAILFYNDGALGVQYHFVLKRNPPESLLRKAYKFAREKAERIERFQGSPVSLTQLYLFLDMDRAPDWWKSMVETAAAVLIDTGVVKIENGVVVFSETDDIELPSDYLTEKRNSDLRRLEMIHAYGNAKDGHAEILRNYLLGAYQVINERTDVYEEMVRNILGILGNHVVNRGTASSVLSGSYEGKNVFGGYLGALPFLDERSIGLQIDVLSHTGLIRRVESDRSVFYRITSAGAEHLEKQGIQIKSKPTAEEDLHDYRNIVELENKVKKWSYDNSVYSNSTYSDWSRSYDTFLAENFSIGGINYTGADIVRLHRGNKRPTYTAFGQLMKLLLDVEVSSPARIRRRTTRSQ